MRLYPLREKEDIFLNFNKISDRLQNPTSTEDQLAALADLRELLASAFELYEKYHNLNKDWTKEIVSGTGN